MKSIQCSQPQKEVIQPGSRIDLIRGEPHWGTSDRVIQEAASGELMT